MSLSRDNLSLLNAVVYPIMFDREPLSHIDRVARLLIEGKGFDKYPPEHYANAIRVALEGNEDLSFLSEPPLNHSPELIRTFLVELKARLESYIQQENRSNPFPPTT